MAIMPGKIKSMRTVSDQAFPYYIYHPTGTAKPKRVLVSIHGITRNALEHAARLMAFCEAQNILLITPYFSRKRFRHFQTLKPDMNGDRPSLAMNQILKDVETRLGYELPGIILLGYSGGGQFAHRFALCHPERTEKIIVSAPGWYTMPCFDTPYPEGLAANDEFSDLEFELKKFCEIPVSVLVGDKDRKREASLNKSPSIDQAQGRNRMERGANWVNALNGLKRKLGFSENVVFKSIQNAGHDFSKNIKDDAYFEVLSGEINA